jgi:hypothetical protein
MDTTSRPVRIYRAARRLGEDHRTPRNEARVAMTTAHQLWSTHEAIRGQNPLRAALPTLLGFSWELEEALDILWPARTLERPEGLDLLELGWWLRGYDFKDLRHLLDGWHERQRAEYIRANAEHRATGGRCGPSDLYRLNILEWTILQAWRESFKSEAGEYPSESVAA